VLTDLASLKSYLNINGAQSDTVLTQIISGVSDEILNYLGREVLVKLRTQTFDIEFFQRDFYLPAAPTHSIESIRYDPDRDFSSTAELELDEYDWESEVRRRKGIISLDRLTLLPGPGHLRVSWVGGWAFDRDYYTTRQDDPPMSPATGSKYLVGATPTGAWVGKENQIATWDGAAWTFQTHLEILRILKPGLESACLNQSSYQFRTKDLQGTQTASNRTGSLNVRSLGLLNSTLDYIRPYRSRLV